MIDKTRLGIGFFDDHHGGIYRNRTALCVGRKGSGKTMAALQAVMQSVREGERGLMLSSWHAHDLAIVAETMGFSLSMAIEKRQVVLLEYADIMPTPEFEKNLTLPPESFMEFQEIVEQNAINRLVIDTVLPWVAIPQSDKLAHHVYSFVRAIERMEVTAIFTIPKPVSALAFTLKKRLEEQIPVVFTLDVDEQQRRTLLINKYLGDTALPPPVPIAIVPGKGICRGGIVAPLSVAVPARGEPRKRSGPIRFAAAGRVPPAVEPEDSAPAPTPAPQPTEEIKFSAAFGKKPSS